MKIISKFVLFIVLLLIFQSNGFSYISCKYIVGNGEKENPLTYTNNDEDGNITCGVGTSFDCREECIDLPGPPEPSVIKTSPTSAQLNAKFPYIDVIVQQLVGDPIIQRQSANNRLIQSGYFEITDSNDEDFPIGTKIFVDDFETDSNGSFSVVGSITYP